MARIFNKTLRNYHPRVIELAQKLGGVAKLAEAIGLNYIRFCEWSRGFRQPDFNLPRVQAKYQEADAKLVALAGLTLADLFAAVERPRSAPHVSISQAARITHDPEALLIAGIDLARLLATLPAKDLSLILKSAKGESQYEIAADLGVSHQSVSQRLMLIRNKLSKRYAAGFRRPEKTIDR